MQELFQTALTNEVFGGIMGGSVVVSILYWIRGLPVYLWRFFTWHFTTKLTVFSEDDSFVALDAWLAKQDAAKRARTLRLVARWDESYRREEFSVTFGIGSHFIWYKARPVLVDRDLANKENPSGMVGRRQETLKITTLGRSQELIFNMVRDIVANHYGSSSDFLTVYLYRSYWRLVSRKNKRSLQTIALDPSLKEMLVRDVSRFLESRDWYVEHGVPYRRGYLFYGPPGCGKTSLLFALASHFSKRIYALNVGSISSDDELIEAMTSVPEDAILLIEDIDAAQKDRAEKTVRPDPATLGKNQKVEEKKLTLSALLNTIDGVFSSEGRILVMTTNHRDKIDEALLREGRVDLEVLVDKIDETEALAMCRRFDVDTIPERVAKELPVPAARLQEEMLRMRGAP